MSIHERNARADAYIKNMGGQKFIDSLDYMLTNTVPRRSGVRWISGVLTAITTISARTVLSNRKNNGVMVTPLFFIRH